MKAIKEKIITISGAVSAFLGGIGIVIAEFGLCACVLAPILSLAGMVSIVMGFLSQNKVYFLMIGIMLLSISFIFYKRKKSCRVHGKKKR